MTNQNLTTIQKTQQFISVRKPELAKMLPEHITIDRFERTVNNALMRNMEIADCDPVSLYDSVMRCAQDGLIPDGKEAAIVVYGGKQGKKAQYQPMIDGVLKRIRQSGLVKSIAAKAVYENDEFDYWFDEDGEHVKYKPTFKDRGGFLLTFGFARLSDGEMIVEIMTKDEIEKVKSASRSGNSQYSPWAQWYERMAVKSVLHRLARRLPTSSETAQMVETLERDINAKFESARDVTPKKSLTDSLLNLEQEPVAHQEPHLEVESTEELFENEQPE